MLWTSEPPAYTYSRLASSYARPQATTVDRFTHAYDGRSFFHWFLLFFLSLVDRWLRVSTAFRLQVLGRKKWRFRFSVTERAILSYEEKVPVSSIPYTIRSRYWHKEHPRGYGSGIGKRLPSALDSIPDVSYLRHSIIRLAPLAIKNLKEALACTLKP